MKNRFWIFFLFLSLVSFAQTNDLIGEWKISKVQSKFFSYDILKNSVVITEEFQKKYPDTLDQKEFLKMATKGYLHHSFTFKKSGNCVQKVNEQVARKIKYHFDKERSIILIEGRAFGDADYLFEMKNKLLYLTLTNNGESTNFSFDKINK